MTPYSAYQNVTIHDLNHEEVMRRLPSLIYMAVLAMVGLPGNLSVLIVFLKHYKESTYRTFIVALASVDLVACAVCMPFEIIETIFQYTFYAVGICKVFRTLNIIVSVSSIFILMGLSVDRFRHVCQPLKIQMSVKVSRIVCIASIALAVFVAWPQFFLSGIRHVRLRDNITGIDCSLSDEYKSTKYPFYHNAVMFLIFIVCIVSLIIMYALIGRKIFQHSRFRKTFRPSFISSSSTSNKTSSTSFSGSSKQSHRTDHIPLGQAKSTLNNNPTPRSHHSPSNDNKSKQKITKVAFAVSVLFILSYLPYLILTTMTAVRGRFVAKPGPIVSAVLPIVTRSVFINSVGNPFIYGILDQRFRRYVKQTFGRRCRA